MMKEIEVGDVFCQYNFVYDTRSLFKIVALQSPNLLVCVVYMENRKVGESIEHRNTLLKMKKLSSLEKELM